MPVKLVIWSRLVLVYCSGLVLQRFIDISTGIWTIELIRYVSTAALRFLINVKDSTCIGCYAYNA